MKRVYILAAIVAAGLSMGCTSAKQTMKDGSKLSVFDLHPFRAITSVPSYTITTDANGVQTVNLTGSTADTSKQLSGLVEGIVRGAVAGATPGP